MIIIRVCDRCNTCTVEFYIQFPSGQQRRGQTRVTDSFSAEMSELM